MDDEYLTLKQAAHLAGYRGADSLREAVRKGRLRTITPTGGVLMTTRAWLEEYRQAVRGARSRRGKAGGTEATGAAGEEASLTNQDPADPPRLPLRVRRHDPLQPPDEGIFVSDEDVVVWPGDPQYEAEYSLAADAYRTYGRAMPYAPDADLGGVSPGNVAPAPPSPP